MEFYDTQPEMEIEIVGFAVDLEEHLEPGKW